MCKFKGYRLVTFSSRIQDSTGKNLPDTGFHGQKFAGLRNPDSLTCGDTYFSGIKTEPAETAVSPRSFSPVGTFRAKERLRHSGRNSIQIT